jgi:hypothetical protein
MCNMQPTSNETLCRDNLKSAESVTFHTSSWCVDCDSVIIAEVTLTGDKYRAIADVARR